MLDDGGDFPPTPFVGMLSMSERQSSPPEYPVHLAARGGNTDVLRRLLGLGIGVVNAQTFDLVTPLHEACSTGSTACARVLLEAGAPVNARNIDGATPLCEAASNGNCNCIQLLLDFGAVVNPPLLLTSPLHEAVLKDNWHCAELLIVHGADLNVTDCNFGTPLHVAAYKGYIKSAVVLLRAGALVNKTKIHHTALHDVARQQNISFISLMLSCGADVYVKNNRGLRAKDLIPRQSSAWEMLHYWERNPPSLMHFCRLKIRRYLGPRKLENITQLKLPRILIDYLDLR